MIKTVDTRNRVNVVVAKTKLDCEHLLGQYLDESHYDTLITEDTDGFLPPNCDIGLQTQCGGSCEACPSGKDERRVAFKFRKNYFSKKLRVPAYEGLKEAATESQNRGLAAGPRGASLSVDGRGGRDWVTDYELEVLDFFLSDRAVIFDERSVDAIRKSYKDKAKSDETRGTVWLRSQVTKEYPEYHNWFDKWVDKVKELPRDEQKAAAKIVAEKWISYTNYAKSVYSGVAGWYDRYPRIPFGRATSYTRDNPEKFALAFPFLQALNKGYRELLPWRYGNQRAAADKLDSRYLVPETVFSTITVNKSFRTAAHRDAGDFSDGVSNLLTLGDGEYTGGYLIFPELRIAVDVRPGDLLLVNNHEIIHGNTEIKLNFPEAERISIVCYLREKMLELGSFEYEKTREQYVEDRRKNKDHPSQRPLWNGITPGMWDEREWYDYLGDRLGEEAVRQYHPDAFASSLDSFFS